MADVKLWVLYRNSWNHLTVCQNSVSFKNVINKMCLLIIYTSSSSSSSSCRVASTNIPDPLSPLLPIIHRLWQVFRATSRSSHSCCMYVRAGRLAFARLYARVHMSTSLMNSSLLLHQCPACLVRLAWIVFVMGGRWPYSWCLFVCYCQD